MAVRLTVYVLALGILGLSAGGSPAAEVISDAKLEAAFHEWMEREDDDVVPAQASFSLPPGEDVHHEFLDDEGYHGYPEEDGCQVDCGPTSPWSIRGWVAQGFTWNPDNPENGFNIPVTFNDRANEYQLNQIYVTMERCIRKESCAWDIGGRVDLLYGTDYFFTQSIGLETRSDGSPRWNSSDGPRGTGAALYGLALPQLYAEVFAPIGHGLSVKMGHFYSILGYESVMAPENFFYSHSYSKQYAEPFTHTGALASYHLTPGLALHAGFTRGWDTWEDPNDELGFLGGASWKSCDERSSLALTVHTGSEDPEGEYQRTAYSLVMSHALSPCLTYVFQHDFGTEEGAAFDGTAKWYGINQYLYYEMSRATELGLRVEWFRDEDNARVLGIPLPQTTGGHYVEVSLGLNWRPCRNWVLRPELRWDWSDVDPPLEAEGIFNDFSDRNQFTLATDLIFQF